MNNIVIIRITNKRLFKNLWALCEGQKGENSEGLTFVGGKREFLKIMTCLGK